MVLYWSLQIKIIQWNLTNQFILVFCGTLHTPCCKKFWICKTFAGIWSAIFLTYHSHILGYLLNLSFFPILVLVFNCNILRQFDMVVSSFSTKKYKIFKMCLIFLVIQTCCVSSRYDTWLNGDVTVILVIQNVTETYTAPELRFQLSFYQITQSKEECKRLVYS